MGIALREILSREYFADFKVIAGFRGLGREVQGVAIMDAPDSIKWARGKEMIVTSGYSIRQEPDCIAAAFRDGYIQRSSALLIKKNRHLDTIPQDIIELCDKHDFPLIEVPYEAPYMEILNEVNICVLNRSMKRFSIKDSIPEYSRSSHKEQQIRKILGAVETEMDFPAFIYDIEDDTSFYSSNNFKKLSMEFGLIESDYWNPPAECTRTTLCEYTHMERIRLVDVMQPNGPHISWILIPIQISGITRAYFAVLEAKEFLDYMDEYSIRIADVMLQTVYENLVATRNMGSIGFESLVMYALQYDSADPSKLIYQAKHQGIYTDTLFSCVRFHQINNLSIVKNDKESIIEIFHRCKLSHYGKIAFIDKNDGIILMETSRIQKLNREQLISMSNELSEAIRKSHPEFQFEYGLSRKGLPFTHLRESIEKCEKAITLGKKFAPNTNMWDYDVLGPLAWLEVSDSEFSETAAEYIRLSESEKGRILLSTLKIYLENNMNFSITSQKMFVHINTIRKRIEKINDILKVDLEDSISRLKVQLILELLDMDVEPE